MGNTTKQAEMTDHLYTIVLDFMGGTYIAQARALSPAKAVIKWAEAIREGTALGRILNKTQLLEGFHCDQPTEICDCTGVWCLSGTVSGELALIHVIRTDDHRTH